MPKSRKSYPQRTDSAPLAVAEQLAADDPKGHAMDVLLDQRLFVLNPDSYDVFSQALDNPPVPGPKLRSLLRRVPAWKT